MAKPYLGEASDDVEVKVAQCPLDDVGRVGFNSGTHIPLGSSYNGNAMRGKNDLDFLDGHASKQYIAHIARTMDYYNFDRG
jgi:hypothetical protein